MNAFQVWRRRTATAGEAVTEGRGRGRVTTVGARYADAVDQADLDGPAGCRIDRPKNEVRARQGSNGRLDLSRKQVWQPGDTLEHKWVSQTTPPPRTPVTLAPSLACRPCCCSRRSRCAAPAAPLASNGSTSTRPRPRPRYPYRARARTRHHRSPRFSLRHDLPGLSRRTESALASNPACTTPSAAPPASPTTPARAVARRHLHRRRRRQRRLRRDLHVHAVRLR